MECIYISMLSAAYVYTFITVLLIFCTSVYTKCCIKRVFLVDLYNRQVLINMWQTEYENFNNKKINNCHAVNPRWVSEPSVSPISPSSASSIRLHSSSRDSNTPVGICSHPWNESERWKTSQRVVSNVSTIRRWYIQ